MKNSINNIFDWKKLHIREADIRFFELLLERDISQNTKKAFYSDLKHFVNWFYSEYDEAFSFSRLTTGDISSYKRFYQEEDIRAPKTINRRLTSLKTLCKLALNNKALEADPTQDIKLLPMQPLAPKALDRTELRKLLKEIELRGKMRDFLIIQMLCGAGLRVSEAVALKLDDVVMTDRKGHLNIRNSKGGKTRKVPLNAVLRKYISDYKEQYQPDDYLFYGQRGPLTPIAVNKFLEFYAKKADVKCSPHTMRHCFAYNFLMNNPGDIVGLSQILGHSNLNTTAVYTQHRLEDLQEKVEKLFY